MAYGFNGYQLAMAKSRTIWRWMVALNLLFNYLHQFNIGRSKRIFYTLVLEKIR
jgi:hypothetical protein